MEPIVVTGMVIKSSNVGEYDKRLVILTRERGKISAFARGARRVNSQMIAGTRLFAFGEFTIYEGKDAYSVNRIDIDNYFNDIANDMEAMCYGCYFLEMADYFSRENIESTEMLKLIYQTLRALINPNIQNRLVRCVYELKMLVINGEYPEVFECRKCKSTDIRYFSAARDGMFCKSCGDILRNQGDLAEIDTSTVYAMQYVVSSKIEKLYTFIIKENILNEFEFIMNRYLALHIQWEFKSLKILNTMLK